MRIVLRLLSATTLTLTSSFGFVACLGSSSTNAPADAGVSHDGGPLDAAPQPDASADTAPDTSAMDAGDACPAYSPIGGDAGGAQIEDGGALPGPAQTQCSATGMPPMTTINWMNNACDPIEAWWVDFNCAEVYYNDVPAMGMFAQQTFVGHRWRLRATGTHALLKEVDPNPDANPRTVAFP